MDQTGIGRQLVKRYNLRAKQETAQTPNGAANEQLLGTPQFLC